ADENWAAVKFSANLDLGLRLVCHARIKEESMRNLVAALGTTLVMLALGGQNPLAAQDTTAGAPRSPAISRTMTAEVLSVNRGAQALTVRRSVNGRESDAIFAVQDAAAPVLDILEPGDLVRVTYVRVNDQLRAQRIVRASAPR